MMPMAPQTRMFRVLVCLAVSMTAGSVLLGWLEPVQPQSFASIPAEQCLAQAKSAVDAHEAARVAWLGVALVPLVDHDRGVLTAVAPALDVHFLVAPSGAVTAGSAWEAQTPLATSADIRIGLPGASADGRVGKAQFTGLRALLDQLNSTNTGVSSLPVSVDNSASNG